MKLGLVIYVYDLTAMIDFYTKLFDFKIRKSDNKYAALENEQTELVLLKTNISAKIGSSQPGFKKRDSTAIKPVFFIDESIEQIREKVNLLGGGFKAKETEWKFNGHIVCDGWDIEGNIFQVRSK